MINIWGKYLNSVFVLLLLEYCVCVEFSEVCVNDICLLFILGVYVVFVIGFI